MVLKAEASTPTSSWVVTGASRVRSPAVTAVAVSVMARIGLAMRRERRYVPIPSRRTTSRPKPPIVNPSVRAGAKAACWLISATSAVPGSGSQR